MHFVSDLKVNNCLSLVSSILQLIFYSSGPFKIHSLSTPLLPGCAPCLHHLPSWCVKHSSWGSVSVTTETLHSEDVSICCVGTDWRRTQQVVS